MTDSKKSRKGPVKKSPTKPKHKEPRRKTTQLPKTARLTRQPSYKRIKASRATSSMSVTDLQFLAKSRGIPFGGLTKTKLIRKINNYF